MKKSLIAAAILAVSTSSAMAEDSTNVMAGTYAELGYNMFKMEGSGAQVEIPTLTASFGKNLNEYFAIEGFLGTGVSEDNLQGFDFTINYVYGLNLKASTKLVESLSGFAKVGYMWSEMEISGYGYRDTGDNDGYLATLGLEYDINSQVYTSLSYTWYESEDSVDENSINLSVGYNF